jgi:hypothetical protein
MDRAFHGLSTSLGGHGLAKYRLSMGWSVDEMGWVGDGCLAMCWADWSWAGLSWADLAMDWAGNGLSLPWAGRALG